VHRKEFVLLFSLARKPFIPIRIFIHVFFHLSLFLFHKKKTCAKRKTKRMFLVKVFTEGKKVVGKAFLSKKRFVLKEKQMSSFACCY